MLFNCNRESSDTGVVYTYNRLPFLTTVRGGPDAPPSLIAADRHERRNLFYNNYGSVWALDHDDGSSWYQDYNNVQVYAGTKHSTFGNGGHSKHTYRNLFLYPDLADAFPITPAPGGGLVAARRPCASGSGYLETWTNNTCVLHAASPSPYSNGCPWTGNLSTIPRRLNNRFLTADGQVQIDCGHDRWSLAQAQAHGTEAGSTVAQDPGMPALLALARSLLGIPAAGSRAGGPAAAALPNSAPP